MNDKELKPITDELRESRDSNEKFGCLALGCLGIIALPFALAIGIPASCAMLTVGTGAVVADHIQRDVAAMTPDPTPWARPTSSPPPPDTSLWDSGEYDYLLKRQPTPKRHHKDN